MKTIRLTESQLNILITESINQILTESFQSNQLRQFFQQHGGVDTEYRQFSLGDISDEQIGYIKEFPSTNDAIRERWKLIASNHLRQRSDYDMKYLFHIFTANDGTAILVGVDRKTIETKPYWSGELQKKVADRLWSNGWNSKIGDNKYVDDSDTYYYQSPAKDFGVHTSKHYKYKMSDNKKNLERTPKEERDKTKSHNLRRMIDYLAKYYPDNWSKLQRNK